MLPSVNMPRKILEEETEEERAARIERNHRITGLALADVRQEGLELIVDGTAKARRISVQDVDLFTSTDTGVNQNEISRTALKIAGVNRRFKAGTVVEGDWWHSSQALRLRTSFTVIDTPEPEIHLSVPVVQTMLRRFASSRFNQKSFKT